MRLALLRAGLNLQWIELLALQYLGKLRAFVHELLGGEARLRRDGGRLRLHGELLRGGEILRYEWRLRGLWPSDLRQRPLRLRRDERDLPGGLRPALPYGLDDRQLRERCGWLELDYEYRRFIEGFLVASPRRFHGRREWQPD